jgi:hypothetical protein
MHNKQFHNKKLILWDNNSRKVIASTQFIQQIVGIKALKNLIVASTTDEVNVCYFNRVFNIIEVRLKICNVSPFFEIWTTSDEGYTYLAINDKSKIKLIGLYDNSMESFNLNEIETGYEDLQNCFYDASSNSIFVVNKNGTAIKGFCFSKDYQCVIKTYELYRGRSPSTITSIIVIENKYIAVNNGCKTIHFFKTGCNEHPGYITQVYSIFTNPYNLNKSIMKIRYKDLTVDDDFFERDFKNKGGILSYDDRDHILTSICHNGKVYRVQIDLEHSAYTILDTKALCTAIDESKNSLYFQDASEDSFGYSYTLISDGKRTAPEGDNRWKII